MSQLENELAANQKKFFDDWTKQAASNWAALSAEGAYKKSFQRLACFNAVKSHLVSGKFSQGSAAFFLEAHNDAIVSNVSASIGAWRSALHALRSCIENVCSAIYYKDHPIELQWWSEKGLYLGFAELHKYLEKHPTLTGVSSDISGLSILKKEYSILSKAVHASAANFRMTDSASSILLWSTEKKKIGIWSSHESKVLEGLMLLMACMNHAQLQGTKLTPVRNMLYFTISPSKRKLLKTKLKITIPSP